MLYIAFWLVLKLWSNYHSTLYYISIIIGFEDYRDGDEDDNYYVVGHIDQYLESMSI